MQVYLDRVDTLSAIERQGVIRSMTRKARIILTPAERPLGANSYVALQMALTLLPAPFSTLADEGLSSLVLMERTPQIAESDPATVDVTLKYDHILDGPNQILRSPPRGILFGKGRCSITEKTTNSYHPDGVAFNPDGSRIPRTQILVAHSFPVWDMGIAGQTLNPGLPYTIIQGGEISIPFPQANFQIQGVINTLNPWVIADQFIACINEGVWLNRPALTWLCSEVQWDVLEPTPPGNADPLYRFGFEFQYNNDTWQPTVVFNDQRTGRPPAGVVQANIRATQAVINNANAPVAAAQAVFVAAQAAAAANPGNLAAQAALSAARVLWLQAASAAAFSVLGPADGVLRFSANPYNGKTQPAGQWDVPCLRRVNFNQLFGAIFEGAGPGGQPLLG